MVLALLEYNALNYCSKLSKQIICPKKKKSKEINLNRDKLNIEFVNWNATVTNGTKNIYEKLQRLICKTILLFPDRFSGC